VTQPEEREATVTTEASAIDSKPTEIVSREQAVAVVPSSDASAGLAACSESVEGMITSLMALPFTPTKIPEDDYADKIIITMTSLHELNIRGKFQHIKNLLNSHERMVWFAKFLVAHHISLLRCNHGFYSRLMQYVGSDFLNGLILSETYRATRSIKTTIAGTKMYCPTSAPFWVLLRPRSTSANLPKQRISSLSSDKLKHARLMVVSICILND
jgi:hypothetical protein